MKSYSIDFYCPELKLAVEVDGDSHYVEGAEEKDRKRQDLIEKYGIVFLRFSDNDVKKNLSSVLDAIGNKLRELRKN